MQLSAKLSTMVLDSRTLILKISIKRSVLLFSVLMLVLTPVLRTQKYTLMFSTNLFLQITFTGGGIFGASFVVLGEAERNLGGNSRTQEGIMAPAEAAGA